MNRVPTKRKDVPFRTMALLDDQFLRVRMDFTIELEEKGRE